MLESIPNGRYLIEISSLHQNLALEGVQFPPNEERVSVTVTINDDLGNEVSKDSASIAVLPSKFFPIINYLK